MADKYLDAAQSLRRSTPVPNWVIDEVLPLLNPRELLVYIYVMRRTWGCGFKSARISVAQISGGTQWNEEWVDRGTGLGERTCQHCLASLRKYRVVRITARASRKRNLPSGYAPGWRDEVDFAGLKARHAGTLAKRRGEGGTRGVQMHESRLTQPDKPDGEVLQDTFEQNMQLRESLYEEESDMAEEYFGMQMPTSAKVRAARLVAMPKPVKAAGIAQDEFVRMRDVVLEMTGKTPLTLIDDPESRLDEQILRKANDVIIAAVAYGVMTAHELQGFEAYWATTGFCRNGVTVPELGNLINQMGKYVKSDIYLRYQQHAKVLDEQLRATTAVTVEATSELDNWQPRRKRRR